MNTIQTLRFTFLALLVTVLAAILFGCGNRPTLFKSSDPALQKTVSQFAADAAKRHPYKASLPRGGTAIARAEINYVLDLINLVNLSDEDWDDVEVWLNREYVVGAGPMPRGVQKSINFPMIFDDAGNSFPTDNNKVRVERVEIIRGGKIYDVPIRLPE